MLTDSDTCTACAVNYNLNLANLFTGFVCGVELWSFIENASTISRAPLFEWLSKWVKRRIDRHVDDK